MTTKRKHPAPPRLAAELHEYADPELYEDAGAAPDARFVVEGYRDVGTIKWGALASAASIEEAVEKAIATWGKPGAQPPPEPIEPPAAELPPPPIATPKREGRARKYGGKRPFAADAARGAEVLARLAEKQGQQLHALVANARYRVVRLSDGAVLSGGGSLASCQRQCNVFNAYSRIAEVKP